MKLNLHLTMRELHASTKALILVVAACFSIETQAQFNVPVPYNPDGTADGFIGVEDLIELLAIFGSEFDSSALVSDSTSAIVHLGEGDYFDCAAWCSELQGNWKVLDEIVVGRYKDEISNMVAEGNSAWLDARSVLGTNYQRAPRVRPSDWYLGESTYNTNHQCICQTRVIEPIVIQAGPCNGLVDLCGICNGPGPVYECGCYEMAEGACDCEGNQLDALGECGGNCIGDFDGDGVCDSFAGGACANEESLDYHGFEYDLIEIGDQCWFAQDLRTLQYSNGDSIVVAHTNAEWQSANDASIGATSAYPGYEFNGSVYNWHSVVDERGLCPSGWSVPSRAEFQELGEFVSSNNTSSLSNLQWTINSLKDDQTWNGTNSSGFTGTYTVWRLHTGHWQDNGEYFYAWSTTNGALGQAYRFQLTAANKLSEWRHLQPFCIPIGYWNRLSYSMHQRLRMTETMKHFFTLMALLLTSVTFGQETCNNVFDYNDNNTIDIEDFLAILGLFADVDLDDDGTWDSLDNCLDLSACNYASELNEPCTYLPLGDCDCNGNVLDECGVCGGTGLAPGTCDCNGTLIDVIGECGGDCWADEDADGICDDVDECVGEYDACDVCNGPGAIYECGCANIPEGECDCDGNVLDAIGVCGGACSADEDADGICDDVDDCVGEFDVCGVCNGPGEVYECGCGDVPEGECDCEGNVLDALGDCGGECLADEDADGVCDDVDDCVGEFDECGVCNGDGAVYECGCNDIPEGECDCDGNVFDECGVCNGPGPTEIVIEDIVTYYDSVYLPFDDAWYVYPVDADTTFGFTCAPLFQSCGDPVSYQGYDYATVQIGEQCWFQENLRNTFYSNGDTIPTYLNDDDWFSTTNGASAIFGEGVSGLDDSPGGNAYDPAWALEHFGRLYNWYAVDDSRGLCPNGWHVPSDFEWMDLEEYLGMSEEEVNEVGLRGSQEGAYMKNQQSFWAGEGPALNTSEFNGLPGVGRPGAYSDWVFFGGYEGIWWTSSSNGANSWWRKLTSWHNGVHRGNGYTAGFPASQRNGFSVRCIQDTPEVLGCTDSSACNFNELANTDDGSCEYESCAPSIHPCGDPISYQGYDYATVQIGEQCWFAENLQSTVYNNGDEIPTNTSASWWGNLSIGATAIYGQGSSDCYSYSPDGAACDESWSLLEYGRLYNWFAVADGRGLCPSGWHVPTDEEWTIITGELGGQSVAGSLMKANYGWHNGGNGTNSSGFTGLPGGLRSPNSNGSFYYAGQYGCWWSSTPEGSDAWRRCMYSDSEVISRSRDSGQQYGHSIRCIQDDE